MQERLTDFEILKVLFSHINERIETITKEINRTDNIGKVLQLREGRYELNRIKELYLASMEPESVEVS